ncbi:hypothetical protein LR48_Vigan10g286000 [Vigna angularis]|uniref:Homeobox domain-containing protein n=1 Tax=Phaseolus angularis TaxID=3914 RepID=A0A0L9VPW0_PHAAN|nr:hypothetical protein LR48_Vigan10g286000 [Vigna angularis]
MNEMEMERYTSQRWRPTDDQVKMMTRIYNFGVTHPSRAQVVEIASRLRTFADASEYNVHCWFNNHGNRVRRWQAEIDPTGTQFSQLPLYMYGVCNYKVKLVSHTEVHRIEREEARTTKTFGEKGARATEREAARRRESWRKGCTSERERTSPSRIPFCQPSVRPRCCVLKWSEDAPPHLPLVRRSVLNDRPNTFGFERSAYCGVQQIAFGHFLII